MKNIDIAMVCKLMPYYRLGIFKELSKSIQGYVFHFLGDTQEQAGIKQIPYSYATAPKGQHIRWIKTKNFFYKPEALLWQTGIIKKILGSKFKVFVFEGGLRHLPIWWFAFLCKLRGKKVLYWTHGNRGLEKGIRKKARAVFFKWLGDGLLLYGHYQRKNMIADGYDPKKLFVIYNSLQPQLQFQLMQSMDSDEIESFKKTLFKDHNLFTIIFIGRLVAAKGVLQILKTIKSLKQQGIDVNGIFIGDGPEKENMVSYCKENGIMQSVHYAGALYDEKKIAPFFISSDMMVSPGNVGLNCIHALAYGVPVATHDDFKRQNPEVEAITEGVTGTFFNYGNYDDLTEKIKSWITAARPKTEIIKNCQKIISEKYNPTYQAKCIIKSLNQTLS